MPRAKRTYWRAAQRIGILIVGWGLVGAAAGQFPAFDRSQEMAFWRIHPCGDHSNVMSKGLRVALDAACKPDGPAIAAGMLDKADPRHDAAAAIARGDYRIGATWPNFPPPPGRSPWETPGLTCDSYSREDLIVFFANWDTADLARRVLEDKVDKYLVAYNTTLLSTRAPSLVRTCQLTNQ